MEQHSKNNSLPSGLFEAWEHTQNVPFEYNGVYPRASLQSSANLVPRQVYRPSFGGLPNMLRMSCTDTELSALTLTLGVGFKAWP